MKTLQIEQMIGFQGGRKNEACDDIETAAVIAGIAGWFHPVITIVGSPIVIVGALCHFFD